MKQVFISIILLQIILSVSIEAQNNDSNATLSSYKIEKQIAATPVKNQFRSNTCWSFAALSMLESELISNGKGQVNLSEMFIVYNTYIEKAERYVRMHGRCPFSNGGMLLDPLETIRKYGIVTEEAYTGLLHGCNLHIHNEMDNALKNYMDSIIKNANPVLLQNWKEGFKNILNQYLGKIPETFVYQGKEYTPRSFALYLGINPDQYLMFTSFTHHPYYKSFVLEVPDNWASLPVYNLPLDDITQLIDYSLDKNYSVTFTIDDSEPDFDWKSGIIKASNINYAKYFETINYTTNSDEITVTAPIRQKSFDDYTTTDDHAMQITGTAKDKQNKYYYVVKNSWGTESQLDGYLYISHNYLKYKIISIMVNKNGVSKDILKKIGLQ